MDQDRQPPPRASNRSCVAHRRADPPETGLRSSQHVLARTTDVSASSPHEATQPIIQAFLQSTLSASTIFESWLPMDSEIFRKGNCNAKTWAGCMSGGPMRVLLAIVFGLIATAANAGSCQFIANRIYCDNGVSGQRLG